MISPNNFRKGLKLMYEGSPFYIVDFLHVKMGRGRPHVKAKLKNLITGQVVERSFLTTESFDEPDLEQKKMQYLYSQGDDFIFMDSVTFEQITIDAEHLSDSKWYLIENNEYDMVFYEGKPISVDLPASVIQTVTETEPAVKGDTVSNVMKSARVESGLEVKVPLFVKEGDRIKIDTRTGEYIERAN
jgi:elongation factor P